MFIQQALLNQLCYSLVTLHVWMNQPNPTGPDPALCYASVPKAVGLDAGTAFTLHASGCKVWAIICTSVGIRLNYSKTHTIQALSSLSFCCVEFLVFQLGIFMLSYISYMDCIFKDLWSVILLHTELSKANGSFGLLSSAGSRQMGSQSK